MWRLVVLGLVACGGATPHESARYDTYLGTVLDAVIDVANQNAKQVEVDREHATVRTAWQILAVTHEPTSDGFYRATANVDEASATKYFARYDIQVVGPRPWHVVVSAHASKWVAGDAKPTEMSDDNPPAWLTDRREHMIDEINRRLQASAIEPR
jgi:hypothetical protein